MQSNSGGLKRTRSPKNQDRVPLPPIDGERMLQVYTHKSLRMPGARAGEDTDNERLSALGERVLEMAVLDALMGERPALSVDVLETRTKDIVDGDVVERWAEQYNMPTKLRCVPAVRDSLSSREEVRAIFHAYVGALFIEQGISSVKQWMEALLGMESHRKIKPLPAMPRSNTQIPQPNASFTQKPFMRSHAPTPSPAFLTSPPMSPIHHMSVSPTPSSASSTLSSSSSTMSTMSSTTWRSQTPGFQTPSFSQTPTFSQTPAFQQPPNPVQYQPPRPSPNTFQSYSFAPHPNAAISKPSPMNTKPTGPMVPHTLPPPPYAPAPNPISPAQPGLAFLPLFNQTAAQRHVTVEYRTEFSGPSHAGKWHATCLVNGIPKGAGSGGNKQIAKEEAARAAYYSMGWS